MPNKGKPRGRNGGRKPVVDPSGAAERISVYLPRSTVRQLEARGDKGTVARDLIVRGLAAKPTPV